MIVEEDIYVRVIVVIIIIIIIGGDDSCGAGARAGAGAGGVVGGCRDDAADGALRVFGETMGIRVDSATGSPFPSLSSSSSSSTAATAAATAAASASRGCPSCGDVRRHSARGTFVPQTGVWRIQYFIIFMLSGKKLSFFDFYGIQYGIAKSET